MDLENTAKLAAIAFGAVAAWNVIISILKGRKSQLREDYKFAKEFIADLAGVAANSEFLQQRGCHALTGDASLEFRTLIYLWQLENPSKAIRDYSLGFKYLQHRRTAAEHSSIQFLQPYENKWRRTALKIWFSLLYLVTYTLAWSPLILHVLGQWSKSSPFPALFVMCVLFLPLAFLALKARVRVQRAENLVTTQRTRPNNSSKPTPLRGAA